MGKKLKKKELGRIPLPRQRSKPHGTKKGDKGYNRKKELKVRPEMIAEDPGTASPERYECEKCGLHKNCKNPFLEPRVPSEWTGFGLFIGEAPRETEDHKGRLGVGPTGKLLKMVRQLASYKKRHFASVNTVRCALPAGTNPTSAQIRFCRPFLLRALDTLKPKNVVLLGRTALTSARNNAGLSIVNARGRRFAFEGTKRPVEAISTYHPDSIVEGSVTHRDEIVHDLKSLKAVRLVYPHCKVPRKVEIIGYDTEYDKDKNLLTQGIASEKEAIAVDVSEKRDTIVGAIIKRATTLVGHNLPGDLDFLVKQKLSKNTWLKGNDIMDSLLLARLHDENKDRGGYGLENLLCSEFRVDPWKEPTATQFKKNPDARLWSPHDRTERCRLDAWGSLKLAVLYAKDNGDRKDLVRLSHQIEMTLYRVGLAGAAVLNSRFHRLGSEWKAAAIRYGDLVTRAAQQHGMNDFELTNKNHQRTLLFDKLHLKKMGYTKKAHQLVVDKKVLQETLKLTTSKRKRTIVKNMMAYASNQKLATICYGGKSKEKSIQFLKVPFPSTEKLSLLNMWINPLGAKTGRRSGGGTDREISHGGSNPQNWTAKLRVLVVSRWHKNGGKMASLDYNQLEPLMMAWKISSIYKGESRLLDYFEKGGGGYILLAKDLLGLTIKKGTKEYKSIKSIYLGLGYFMNDWKLAHDLWYKVDLRLSEDRDTHVHKTKKIRKKYIKMVPEVKEYHRTQNKEVERHQQVTADLGMVRHLPHLGKDMEGYKRFQNQAINFPMQYLASLVTGSALVDYEAALMKEYQMSYMEWHKALLENPYELPCSPVVNEIHDELLLDMHPKTGKRDLEILHEAMTGVPTLRKMIPTFKVKLSLSEHVGETWT